jgi:hypothetical protein
MVVEHIAGDEVGHRAKLRSHTPLKPLERHVPAPILPYKFTNVFRFALFHQGRAANFDKGVLTREF